jgi:hypothetical protein
VARKCAGASATGRRARRTGRPRHSDPDRYRVAATRPAWRASPSTLNLPPPPAGKGEARSGRSFRRGRSAGNLPPDLPPESPVKKPHVGRGGRSREVPALPAPRPTHPAGRASAAWARRSTFRFPARSFQNDRGIPIEYSWPPTHADASSVGKHAAPALPAPLRRTFPAASHAPSLANSSGEAGIAQVCPRNTSRRATRGGGRPRGRRPAHHAAPARAARRPGSRPSTPCPGAHRGGRRRLAG